MHLTAAGQAKHARLMPKPLTKAFAQAVWDTAKDDGLKRSALYAKPADTLISRVIDPRTSQWQLKVWLQKYCAGHIYAARALKFARFATLVGPANLHKRRNVLINLIQLFSTCTYSLAVDRMSDDVFLGLFARAAALVHSCWAFAH